MYTGKSSYLNGREEAIEDSLSRKKRRVPCELLQAGTGLTDRPFVGEGDVVGLPLKLNLGDCLGDRELSWLRIHNSKPQWMCT